MWGVPTASRDGLVAPEPASGAAGSGSSRTSLPPPQIPFLAALALLGLAPQQIPSSRDLPAVSLCRERALVQGVCAGMERVQREAVLIWGSVLVLSWGCGGEQLILHPPKASPALPSPRAEGGGSGTLVQGNNSQYRWACNIWGWLVPDWVPALLSILQTLGQAQILEVDRTWVHSGLDS